MPVHPAIQLWREYTRWVLCTVTNQFLDPPFDYATLQTQNTAPNLESSNGGTTRKSLRFTGTFASVIVISKASQKDADYTCYRATIDFALDYAWDEFLDEYARQVGRETGRPVDRPPGKTRRSYCVLIEIRSRVTAPLPLVAKTWPGVTESPCA